MSGYIETTPVGLVPSNPLSVGSWTAFIGPGVQVTMKITGANNGLVTGTFGSGAIQGGIYNAVTGMLSFAVILTVNGKQQSHSYSGFVSRQNSQSPNEGHFVAGTYQINSGSPDIYHVLQPWYATI